MHSVSQSILANLKAHLDTVDTRLETL